MKKVIIILIGIALSVSICGQVTKKQAETANNEVIDETDTAQAQGLPSIPANGFAFPLGSKFVIRLIPADSVNYDYSVLSFEPFQEIIDRRKTDDLFEQTGENNTIVFYFCLGTDGETEQEREENMRVFLLIKNYSKEILKYTSEIQREEDGEYEETSNIGTFPNATGREIWPYMIYSIGLREFRKYE
jgi:hypothetical protein